MISISFRSFLILFALAIVFTLLAALIKFRKTRAVLRRSDVLKRDGNKIVVNFDECELTTREYYEERQTDEIPNDAQMVDGLLGVHREPGQNLTTVSVLIFRYKNGSAQVKEFRSELIYMPEVNLRLCLER